MSRRLVERFAVGDAVDVRLAAPGGETWIPGRVVAHAHPAVWVETAGGARWFVTNGGRIRERGRRPSGTVYKIASRDEWARTEADGVYPGSPADARDGYVHLSTGAQVRETAARHFAGRDDLVLLDVSVAALARSCPGALRWEPSRGGELFPHLHAKLPRDAVAGVRPLPVSADGAHEFPPLADAT